MKIGYKFTPFSFPPGGEERKVKVKLAQSCPTLCNPMNYTVHGILQARILEWVASPFSGGSSRPEIQPRSPALQAVLYQLSYARKGIGKENRISTFQKTHTLLDSVYVPENSVSSLHSLSCVQPFETPWTAAR